MYCKVFFAKILLLETLSITLLVKLYLKFLICCPFRYGYKDVRDCYKFENQLIEAVAEFLKQEAHSKEMAVREQSPSHMSASVGDEVSIASSEQWRNEIKGGNVEYQEVNKLKESREAGVAYMMGNNYVVARPISPLLKKFSIDIVYGFLRRNCRRPAIALGVPHTSLIEVGMLYQV